VPQLRRRTRATTIFCELCGSEVKNLSALPITLSDQPTSTEGQAVQTPPVAPGLPYSSEIRKLTPWGLLAIVGGAIYLGCVFLVSVGLRVQQSGNWAEAFGYVTGASLIPAAIVLIYYNRKRGTKASSARVVTVLASWILVANLVAIGRNGSHLTKEDIPVIAKEAAGLVPISNPDDAGRGAVRDCFKQVVSQNRDYTNKVNGISFEDLYTPKSYSDLQVGQRVLGQIQAAIDIEAGQESALNGISSYCEAKINSLDWPDAEKKSFIDGFDEKFQESKAKRVPVVSTEKEWFTSLRDLYVYALDNHRYFQAAGANVRISNPAALAEFNKRVEHANQLREKFQAAKKEFDQAQRTDLSQSGVSGSDLGLKP
jgi:hypothetical protein